MDHCVLFTGGTGFLGTELAAGLIKKEDLTVYVLVRAADRAQAVHRLKAAWQHDPALVKCIGGKIVPVPGDFTKPGLGLDKADSGLLSETITHVFHAGAQVSFKTSRQELKNTNFAGTKQVLAFARKIQGLQRFIYISTAYVQKG